MIEKVNPSHPDKIADRIAGAIVDLAYKKESNPKVAVELLIGHGICHIIIETNVKFENKEIENIVTRIDGPKKIYLTVHSQDINLSHNQDNMLRCGDNGIFRGIPLSKEEKDLSKIARRIYEKFPYDGKYIMDKKKLIICQSHDKDNFLKKEYPNAIVNPLGYWTGGTNVDTGAVNRKLGSDQGRSVTGGGIHGKDLSKADVSVNIYAFLKAQKNKKEINISCAIGDKFVDGQPYEEIVNIAKKYIDDIGGFEELAKWGLY